jgi:hypothetical protein
VVPAEGNRAPAADHVCRREREREGGRRDHARPPVALDGGRRLVGRVGGFYDHVPPPTADGTDGGVTGLNSLLSYGFRVPLLVISPWVKDGPLQDRGYASNVFYSHASFARFTSGPSTCRPSARPTTCPPTRPASRGPGTCGTSLTSGFLRLLGLTAEGQGHPAGARLSQADTRAADAGCQRTRRLTSVHCASCRR